MKKLAIIKTCNTCQKQYTHLPNNAKPWLDDECVMGGETPHIFGYDFQCDCGSNLFVKFHYVSKDEEVSSGQ